MTESFIVFNQYDQKQRNLGQRTRSDLPKSTFIIMDSSQTYNSSDAPRSYNNFGQQGTYSGGYYPDDMNSSSFPPFQYRFPQKYTQASIQQFSQQYEPEPGRERGLMEHIPFTPQHVQYQAQKHQHPLARILNKEGDHISL